jgi:hypothetical protein
VAERIAAELEVAAALSKASTAAAARRGLQASVVAPAEPVLVAVRGEAEADPEVEVVAAEVAVAAGSDALANRVRDRYSCSPL